MDHPIAAGVRRQHEPAVRANDLRIEHRWGRPCLAYLAVIHPGPAAAAALSAVQEGALGLEPGLLRVPAAALHSCLLWLLPVQEEFGEPKDELWRRHGPGWAATLAGVTRADRPFRLRYRHLLATDAAIIAVAEEPNRLGALRRELAPVLRLPGPSSAGQLVHITLFRYAEPLRDPAALLRWLDATEIDVEVDVSELLIVRESVFPALGYQVIRRFPLDAHG